VFAVSKRGDPYTLEIIDIVKETHKTSCVVPEGWFAPCAGVSSNIQYGAVLMYDFPGTAGEQLILHQYRISVFDVRKGTLTSKAEVSAEVEGLPTAVAVSDNGRYAAVIGWDNGIGMFDMQTSSMLWSGRPKEEISTRAAVFGPHLGRIYTAGTEGAVYEIEVRTGKVLDKWWASPTKTSEYGHRANCLAISGDGRWLAVGTGPEGRVYLLDLKNPDTDPKLVPHGEGTIYALSFSPDGSSLATIGGGYLKTWKIRE
jgi:WD40 repeat protein